MRKEYKCKGNNDEKHDLLFRFRSIDANLREGKMSRVSLSESKKESKQKGKKLTEIWIPILANSATSNRKTNGTATTSNSPPFGPPKFFSKTRPVP
jgi:hypothetical protein